jgi:hypothetical protein
MSVKSSGGSGKSSRRPKASGKSDSAPKKRNKSGADENAKVIEQPLDPAAQQFIEGVLIRGEAARPSAGGALPPNVTHKIVDDNEDGSTTIEREGFSIY